MTFSPTLALGVALVLLAILIQSVFHYITMTRRRNEYGTIIVKGYLDSAVRGMTAVLGRIITSLVALAGFGLIGMHFLGWDIVGEGIDQVDATRRAEQIERNPATIAAQATHFATSMDANEPSRVILGSLDSVRPQNEGRVDFPFGTCIVAEPERGSALNVLAAPGVAPPAWTLTSGFSAVDSTMRCNAEGMLEIARPDVGAADWQATHRVTSQSVELRDGPMPQFPVSQTLTAGTCVMLVDIDTPNWVAAIYRNGDQVASGFMRRSAVPFAEITAADRC